MSNNTMRTAEELFGSNDSLEKEGIFVLLGDIRVKLAYAGLDGANTAFHKRLAELAKPFKRVLQHELMDLQQGRAIEQQAYAEHVIKTWETFQPGEGEAEGKYVRGIRLEKDGVVESDTVDNRLKKLKAMPKLWSAIQEESNRSALYREVLKEEDLKNS